jgi:Domain of unknown function (DUF1839)
MIEFSHRLFALNPEDFSAHSVLHGTDENFRETNCYADLIIEIVHQLGLTPTACLAYTLAADFEADQWTFAKPSGYDLQTLYGIRVEELALYRPLVDQLVTQVERGCIPLLEADAFHLPDAIGIDYRTAHVKTTIGISKIDVEHKVLHYFHNATFAQLEGEDFDGILTPLASFEKGYLPPYCEFLKLNQLHRLPDDSLRAIALKSAAFHFRKRGNSNPIRAYAQALTAHQEAIIKGGIAAYHAYTFVAPRQLGSAHQLGAHFLRWLNPENADLVAAAAEFDHITQLSKSLVLKLARVANSGKIGQLDAILDEMATSWDVADQHLHTVLDAVAI